MRNILLVIMCSFMLSACGFEVVDTGHRGVETRFGKVVSESLPEGLYFYNPFTSDIKELDTRIQKGINKTTTYSKDAQLVDVTSTINFHLKKNVVHTVYEQVGFDWSEKLILQVLEGTIKEVTGSYIAVDIIANREKATAEIRALLKERLLERSIILTAFEINNLDFDDAFEQAVKDKVIAVERAKEAQNRTVTVREQATQKVISAKAEAQSMQIRAKALTQNKALVEYEAVQKWNGVMPTMMLGGGSVPFINLNSK